ncbi:MAG: undecaprenyl-diphosphatase UppP [Deltaproteobacteria bacterium]
MTIGKAILLGILQGLTEFLPVSSSGHLVLAQRLLGIRGPELAFDLLLHLGTVLAILVFLRREIAGMLGALFRRSAPFDPPEWGRREILLILLASIPTAAIGFTLKEHVETGVTLRGVGWAYLLLTVLLLMSNLRFRHKLDPERISALDAVAIGIAQGAAVLPGLSRSGSTISLALMLGIGASRSAKFSFLISLPAILGAALLTLYRGVSPLPGAGASAAGFLCALVSGYLVLLFVERLVTRGRFLRFAPYTLLLAALSWGLYWKG